MRRWMWLGLALVAGCGEEVPTGVGGPLLPANAIRTFEVVLDAADYLETDTSFSGYTSIRGANYQVVARDFEGTLNAHALARFDLPAAVAVTDSAGVVKTDSTPTFTGGRFVARIDTLRSNIQGPLRFRLSLLEEEWDPATASWTWRIDSAGAQLPWAQPGAAGGGEITTVDWTLAGEDSLVIPVDSITLAAWSDTTTRARGARLSLLTDDARVRLADVLLRVDARSEVRPDTLFTTTVRPPDPTFVFDPALPDRASKPLVSGSPGWRTFFKFRSDLRGRTVPCPLFAGCSVRLDQTAVTYAALLLEPDAAPPGYLPQDSLLFETRIVYASDRAPLARSPIGTTVGVTPSRVGPRRFRDADGTEPIEVPLTPFMVGATSADTTLAPPSPWVALLPWVEGVDFGVAAFRKSPRLRLVLTIASEMQLR